MGQGQSADAVPEAGPGVLLLDGVFEEVLLSLACRERPGLVHVRPLFLLSRAVASALALRYTVRNHIRFTHTALLTEHGLAR